MAGIAGEWDALWARNGALPPTKRATHIRLWHEHFAPRQPVRVVTVREGGSLVGGLPLVENGWPGALSWGTLPNNHWATTGALLVDHSERQARVIEAIVAGLAELPWRLLLFTPVQLEDPDWQQFMATCRAAGWHVIDLPLFRAGRVELQRPWEAWEGSWSAGRRRSYSRHIKRAEKEGPLHLEILEPRDPDEAGELFRVACEIEHRSWKGPNGTSLLSQPTSYRFYEAQVRELAPQGRTRFVFLCFKGQRIAFSLFWLNGQYIHAPKTGYDAAFRELSPGRLLEYLHIRSLCHTEEYREVDFMGPCPRGHEHWANRCDLLGNILVYRPGLRTSLFARAYQLRRRYKQWRKPRNHSPGIRNCDPSEPQQCAREQHTY